MQPYATCLYLTRELYRDILWPSWLTHCATGLKIVFSIPDGVTGIFL
jgi:hypothetical protein